MRPTFSSEVERKNVSGVELRDCHHGRRRQIVPREPFHRETRRRSGRGSRGRSTSVGWPPRGGRAKPSSAGGRARVRARGRGGPRGATRAPASDHQPSGTKESDGVGSRWAVQADRSRERRWFCCTHPPGIGSTKAKQRLMGAVCLWSG